MRLQTFLTSQDSAERVTAESRQEGRILANPPNRAVEIVGRIELSQCHPGSRGSKRPFPALVATGFPNTRSRDNGSG